MERCGTVFMSITLSGAGRPARFDTTDNAYYLQMITAALMQAGEIESSGRCTKLTGRF